ncbi:uncharacterized protein LAESUDRAFT_682400 [Laetiporus sulphureus 93-53]|uniref:Uncharacterized protein n=1 Tax=Laetiporus sulphureus 93-53 TaxID=1314785 RepID=A0A165DD32_9APHY|nr:uncharacterized protein LAESUDRAFT_682400 [Laetiporus sulphureus 93-53]KZT04603.1 hypothetical protein LAESUDRAFT_682400 [Laetiporus sulphureus 93-53]
MSSLSEHVDRLSLLAKSIRSSATNISRETTGPFTEAVLHTPLGDLIRDVDPAELGLFTLVSPAKPADPEVPAPSYSEIARAEFHGATPLKKPPAPRKGRHDPQGRPGEHDPEVYARAAIKYLDRYRSIRPMPRASDQAIRIMEQLGVVRSHVRQLSEQLKQHSAAGPPQPPASPKSVVREEEQRVQAAQEQLAELRKRKEVLLKQKASGRIPRPKVKPRPQTPPPPPVDEQEDTFWNTPAASARTLHFAGDSLLDEHVDLADVSVTSFATPIAPRIGGKFTPKPSSTPKPKLSPEDELDMRRELSLDDDSPVSEIVTQSEEPVPEDDAGGFDRTVMLSKSTPPQTEASEPDVTITAKSEPATPTPPLLEAVATPGPHRHKIKVTTELEQIAAKIWATIGEVIMPGSSFDVSGEGGSKPPHAKETIAHLQTLSTKTPSPSSPSTASLSSFSFSATIPASSANLSQPTAQQVLTAHMLLVLLSSPPSYAMPLGKLKESLNAKTEEIGISASAVGGSGATRPIYGCVAKRLLKIERGGGEQVVKFDI